MELSGKIAINATPKVVWQALNSPDILQRCIPGCEEVRRISEHETHTRVAIKLGPVRARFVGKIMMADVRPDQGCTLQFEGSGGAAGFARGQSTVDIIATGDSESTLNYTAQASIGGKLGQIGGRMIDASAKQMADQFFAALQEAVQTTRIAAPIARTEHLNSDTPASSATTAAPIFTSSPITSAPVSSNTSEGVRVLWFLLGAGATGFGVAIAALFLR